MLTKKIAKLKRLVGRVIGYDVRVPADLASNGEEAYLAWSARQSAHPEATMIVDVGANVGSWTDKAIKIFSGTSIRSFHCVEPIPTYVEQLQTRFGGRADCVIHQTLLSNSPNDKVPIYEVGGGGRMYPPRASKGASASAVGPIKSVHTYSATQTTGDLLVEAIGEAPHFIKIDCDGHDWFVLSGFEQTLRHARPFVQFEYCDFWIAAGARLKDACRLLDELDYETFFILPDHLQRFRYSWLRETYRYCNIAAIPKDRVDQTSARVDLQLS